MERNNGILSPEDYEEPVCPLCDVHGVKGVGIPMERVAEKLDQYFAICDYAGAERHLRYWLAEAQAIGDLRGEFSVRNEMMGLFRKLGNREEATEQAEAAVALAESGADIGTISAATAYLNAGTVFDAFDMAERAIGLFERAKAIYEAELPPEDSRLGGLYNNMALALVALDRFDEANTYFNKALAVMEQTPGGEPERAITKLNMADAAEACMDWEEAAPLVGRYLEEAARLLDTEGLPHDGYYAFVCEKCAPGFLFYGYDGYAEELERRANEIYGKG